MISKLILTTLLLAGGASAVAQQSVYLSDRGNDQGDGTKEHPYYSLNKRPHRHFVCVGSTR